MALASLGASASGPRLVIGNTESGGVAAFDIESGAYLGAFLAPTNDGSTVPDDLTPDRHGRLFIALGADRPREGTGVAAFALPAGEPLPIRLTAPTLVRPYGVAVTGDRLLVAAFRTDAILEFDLTAPERGPRRLAAGSGTVDGLNGPNDLLPMPDGRIWITTQGSVAARDGTGAVSFEFPSQLLALDPASGGVEVLHTSTPITGAGFTSLLGLVRVPDSGHVFATDFAGALLEFSGAGELLGRIALVGDDPVRIGNLVHHDSALLVTGFDAENLDGFVLKVPLVDGALPDPGSVARRYIDDPMHLRRPVGIAVIPPPSKTRHEPGRPR